MVPRARGFLPRRHRFVGRLGQGLGHDQGQAAVFQDLAARLDVGPGETHHQGDLEVDLLHRLDHALGHPVAAVDAGEDVDQDGLHLVVGEHQVEGLGDALGRGPAADVEEIGGLATGVHDHVHGRHREPRAVDDAADVAVQSDIAQTPIGGGHLARVLLGLVAQLRDARPPEQGVVVEGHLGIEGEQAPVLGHDQRVDLDHGGVEVAQRPVAALDGRDRLARERRRELEAEGQLATLEVLHADRGLDRLAQDGLRPLDRDLLDLHAALARGHHHDALRLPVQDEAQIDLPVDGGGGLDIEAVHDLAARTRLMGDQALAEQFLGGLPDLVVAAAHLDAAGLAARAGVDLGLDDPAIAADLLGPVYGLLGAVGEAAGRHGDAEVLQ